MPEQARCPQLCAAAGIEERQRTRLIFKQPKRARVVAVSVQNKVAASRQPPQKRGAQI